jgi:hypothetical protein
MNDAGMWRCAAHNYAYTTQEHNSGVGRATSYINLPSDSRKVRTGQKKQGWIQELNGHYQQRRNIGGSPEPVKRAYLAESASTSPMLPPRVDTSAWASTDYNSPSMPLGNEIIFST